MAKTIIHLQAVSNPYRIGRFLTDVLEDFELQVPAGEFLAEMGLSGTGSPRCSI